MLNFATIALGSDRPTDGLTKANKEFVDLRPAGFG